MDIDIKNLLREILAFNRDHLVLDDEPYNDTEAWNKLGDKIASVLKNTEAEQGQCRLCGSATDAGRTCVECSVRWGF
jgi:hypothetical protein